MREPRIGGENRRFLIFAAILILVTGVIIVMLRPDAPESAIDRDRPEARDELVSTAPEEPVKRKKKARVTESTALPSEFGTSFPGLGVQPGLDGEGRSYSLEKHKVTIRWSSKNGLGLIAHVVPTSGDNSRGSHLESGSHFSISTVAYGKPDYAVAFVQAGADGVPATCEITVDGRVTDRRTTEGPYGSVWCQG